MKFAVWILFIALLIAFASAGIIPEEEYLPPVGEDEQIAPEQPLEESAALAKDGYRYKTVRKLRHRRDVSELFAQGTLADDGYHYHAPKPAAASPKISQAYLPPVVVDEAPENKEVREASKVSNEYLPPPLAAVVTTKSPEISREYLPPTDAPATLDLPKFAASEELPSLDDDAVIVEGPGPEEPTILADDGYHYRRIRYRRDVSEIAPAMSGYSYEAPADDAEEIKPQTLLKESIAEPTEEVQEIVKEYLPPTPEIKTVPETPSEETAELAEDGYRYKTIRKLKYRQRRDVSEIVSTEKEAKAEEVSTAATVEEKESIPGPTSTSVEYLPPSVAEVKEADEVPSETAELAEDGYRYKTIRKLKYRQRRDVSHILAPESAVLDKDGYHYRIPEPSKIISKVSNEYLPPSDELRELSEEPKEVEPTTETSVVTEPTTVVVTESTTIVTEAAPVVTESTTVVTEAPSTTAIPAVSNEYLPPVEEVPKVKEATEAPSTTPTPAVSNEYLPPVKEVPQAKEASEISQETAILADDGYHYKVGKRFRFRRDVSEIASSSNGYAYEAPEASNEASSIYLPPAEVKEAVESTETPGPQVSSEYLPPASESKDDAEIIETPEESSILADDGYHYKTVRRLKYRHRRDVSEIVPPPAYVYPTPAAIEEETASLADDGYRYKTVRRLRYRHRRDVSHLVPESAILAEDGYHYKTPSAAAVKASSEYLPPVEADAEIVEALVIEPTIAPEAPQVSSEYLPPFEGLASKDASPAAVVVSNEYLPPSEVTAELPQDSAVLADDGYRYKTVRRIRYRHRRDVSEIATPQAEGYAYDAPIEVQPQEIQYLPPVVEEAAQVKEAIETAPLADDGYRYKTIRRIRYRHRV